jgi:hypothetical protein
MHSDADDSESFFSNSDEEGDSSDVGLRRSTRATRGKKARRLESSSDDDADRHPDGKACTPRKLSSKRASTATFVKDSRLANFDLARIAHRRPPLKDIVAGLQLT